MLLLSAVGCLSEAELAYNDGVDSLNQELYAEAISDYDKVIQLDPDHALASTVVLLTATWVSC